MLEEDLSAFLEDLGVTAYWTTAAQWTVDSATIRFDQSRPSMDGSPTGVGNVQSAQVIFDAPDSTLLAGRVQSTEYRMLYRTQDLQGLAYLSQIEIEGTYQALYDGFYRVKEILLIEDGLFQEARLEAVN